MKHFLFAVLAIIRNLPRLKTFRREQIKRYDTLCFIYQNHFTMTQQLFYRLLRHTDYVDLTLFAEEIRRPKRSLLNDISYEATIRQYAEKLASQDIRYSSLTIFLYYIIYKAFGADLHHFFVYLDQRLTHQLRMFTGVDFGCVVEDVEAEKWKSIGSLASFSEAYKDMYIEFVFKMAASKGVSRVYDLDMDM